MKKIKLTQGKIAFVDDDDYNLIIKYKWYAVNYHDYYYAVTEIKGTQIKMHRLILNAPDNIDIDHIDHDGLNNQRLNLRFVTLLLYCKFDGCFILKLDEIFFMLFLKDLLIANLSL